MTQATAKNNAMTVNRGVGDRLRRLALVLCLLLPVIGNAGTAKAQTLEDALVAAYRNNPTLLGQRAKVRATDEQVPQALSNWRPSIEISGSAGVNAVQNTTSTDRGQHRESKVNANRPTMRRALVER